MGVNYLKHPIHGQIACGDLDANVARANGWEDFDPTIKPEPAPSLPSFLQPPTEVVSDLPADFPGRMALIEGNLTTWASVVGLTGEQLQAVKGIGAPTANRILGVMNS
jgi:hypothetical protein